LKLSFLGFVALDAFSPYPFVRNYPAMPFDNRYISGTDLEVLAYNPNLDFCFFLIADISRAVSRRSELKSRTVLMDEQSNPWELLHPQDTMIQHRIVLSIIIGM
jgi:hypothetical protein